MADGLNQARALRIAEIITDYRNIQNQIAGFRANPSAREYNEVGFALLRQCESEARALLASPFQASTGGARDEEQIKQHLKRIIIDAAVRRFKVQRIYCRMIAAQHWINRRAQVLQAGKSPAETTAMVSAVTDKLRQDVAAITDLAVMQSLHNADEQARKWLQEDPSLSVVQRFCGN